MSSWNLPDGVTGAEYEIAGPDWEREIDEHCIRCTGMLVELGYRQSRWTECGNCGKVTDMGYEDPMDYSDDLRDIRRERDEC